MRLIYWVWAVFASGIVCLLFLGWGKINLPEFLWLWPICWLSGSITFQQNLMLGLQKFAWFNLLTFFSSAGIFIVLWTLLAAGYLSTNSYLFSLSLVWVVVFLVGIFLLKPFAANNEKGEHVIELAKKMFASGGVNQSVQVVSIMNNRFIYSLLPAATLGVFSNALALAEAMLLLPGSLGQIFYANMVTRSQTAEGIKAIKKMMVINIGLLFAGWLAILIVPGSFYDWLFGAGFTDVKQYLVVLSAGIVGYGIYLLASYWQSAAGKFHKNLQSVSVGLAVNVAGFFILKGYDLLSVMNLTYLLSASFLVVGVVAMGQLLFSAFRKS
jgi:O-antigen/teichoic acid export membrane protein